MQALASAETNDTARLLKELNIWSEQGWVRRLDSAFAHFMVDLSPGAAAPVVLSAALVAHMEGRGHSCLPIDELLRSADDLLGWAPEATARFGLAMADLPGNIEDWLAALRCSPLVATEGRAQGNEPLVLSGNRLYLRRYWYFEQQVAAQVLQRGSAREAVDTEAVRKWLDRLFPPPESGDAAMDWQKAACGVALRAKLSVITGGPGTGKTYTAARLLALLFAVDPAPQRLRVALAAPTGKAAARLKQAIGDALEALQASLGDSLPLRELASHIGAARTLHSLLGARPDTRKFAFDAAHPLELDVLIVDEASMIHLEMMAALLVALPPRARVIFLGDKDQLASVEAGAVLGDLCRDAERGRYRPETVAFMEAVTGLRVPPAYVMTGVTGGPALAQQVVMLRTSRRFSGPIGQLALAVNRGDAQAASSLLPATPGQALQWLGERGPAAVVQLALQGRVGAQGGYRSYLQCLKVRPEGDEGFEAWVMSVLKAFERFKVLCAVRDGDWGVAGLNVSIERALAAEGLLARHGEWYEGRPIMVTRNDAGVGVFNGDIGIVLRAKPRSQGAATALRAYFLEGNTFRSVGVSRLADVETAFAMTVHKSQGSEFEHTVLVLPQDPSRVLTRELVYTGITRARTAFTLVTGRRQALGDALAHQTRRSSGLLDLLKHEEGEP